MASISERIYIRWLPDEAKEPTSTLVTTSAKSFFVDIRILQDPPHELYWGFAGISYKDGSQGRWMHTVDSRSDNPTEDFGSFEQLTNGDWLEKGKMLDFDDGKVKVYEEVWRDSEILPRISTVLVLEEDGGKAFQINSAANAAKGTIVRVGNYCQGIMKVKGEVTCERWTLDQGAEEWRRIFRTGNGVLPCQVACIDHSVQAKDEMQGGGDTEGNHEIRKFEIHTEIHNRDEITYGEHKWRIVENSTW
ncbi:hypothetical protein Q9L58_000374 [Maublancomyces gigas]|uniref:Protein HRI1 n=1 Tax=Discina gigas TaxID=1032678 RepID=A0ABR3GXH8_9PEZI